MNCNEFKEKVADLFDKNIDMQTQVQLSEHMDNCPECKAYYGYWLEPSVLHSSRGREYTNHFPTTTNFERAECG